MKTQLFKSFATIRELYSDSGIMWSMLITMYLFIVVPCVVAFALFQLITTPIYYLIVMILPKGQ
jgi:hypothetical protein